MIPFDQTKITSFFCFPKLFASKAGSEGRMAPCAGLRRAEKRPIFPLTCGVGRENRTFRTVANAVRRCDRAGPSGAGLSRAVCGTLFTDLRQLLSPPPGDLPLSDKLPPPNNSSCCLPTTLLAAFRQPFYCPSPVIGEPLWLRCTRWRGGPSSGAPWGSVCR